MDIPIVIITSLVFLVSLCSLLFINRFFSRKTFEEIVAEKKAFNEKIFGHNKTALKKPKKLQQLKKESKREKKQRQREQQKDTTEQEDSQSDQQSEQPESVDEEQPQGLSKVHVEFEPDPEVVTFNSENAARRVSNAEREGSNTIAGNAKPKSKREKRKVGILVNKNEPILLKEHPVVEEQLNNFEAKPPKDVVELKKQDKKDDKKEDKQPHQSNAQTKKEKLGKKEKQAVEKEKVVEQQIVEIVSVVKEVRQLDEKPRQGSPKIQQQNAVINNNNNNNSNSNQNSNQNHKTKQQNKKHNKDLAKEHSLAVNKLSENDTIGVSLLMNLFRHAELNRSEIQILIDYLLNKQQDMPSSHSEWSDDICQKLKRQLEEKERLLAEEQEASIGIQAKLRELRNEINTERAQINATVKAYVEKMQSKDQEINGLNQELQSVNEKLALERQQFQAKLLREKQTNSQELLGQLQLMQNEISHKDKCIAELTCLVNASRQAVEEAQQQNEILQTQSQQIRALEQQRDELEEISNNRVFELEKVKTLEAENAESKVEIRNLQNELESSKADLNQAHKNSEAIKAELNHVRNLELGEKQKEIQTLQNKNVDLAQQLAGSVAEKFKEHSGLQVTLDALQTQLGQKEQEVSEYRARNEQLVQRLGGVAHETSQHMQVLQLRIESLQADAANKTAQLQHAQLSLEKLDNTEKELLQQLNEQKEKNNQQQQLLAAAQKPSVTTSDSSVVKEQKHIRELFQRLYPDAVKDCAAAALSASFDHWVDQVLATHIKQSISKLNASSTTTTSTSTNTSVNSSSNKTTQSNNNDSDNNSSSNHNSTPNDSYHNNANPVSNEVTTNNNGSENRLDSSSSSSSNSETIDVQKLHTQNAQLRAKIDELTKLVTKTSNTLSDLEGRAREQDAHWRSIVRTKDEQIFTLLQHSNGEQKDI